MLKEIENNKYFEEKILKKWEILFTEWDFDQNIYIIKKWKLKIEKYFSKDKTEKKSLAILWENSIFWEWSLSNNDPKEVIISATEDTELYFIKSENFKDFIKNYTEIWIKFLTQIINLSNKRLLESNFLLTTNYKIWKMISETEDFSNKNLFKILDEFLNILQINYIIFAEVNKVLDNYVNIIYDTRKPWKLLNHIFEIKENKFDLEKFSDLDITKNNIILDLKNWKKIIWFLILWKSWSDFSDSEKKSINSVWVLLAWFVKQKQDFQNEKDREK